LLEESLVFMAIKKFKSNNGRIFWEVRFYADGRNSKRIRRRFDKRIEAEEFLFNMEAEAKEKARSPFGTCTFDSRIFKDEAEHWLRDGEHQFSPGYLKRVEGILSEILPKFGPLTLDRFTPDFLTKYQREEKARGLENSTVNKKTQVITGILNFSARQRRIPFNPSLGFRKLNWIKPEMAFWSKDEAMDFLKFASEKYPLGSEKRWVYVVYLLAINTGLRSGEIWGLKPLDLNKSSKTLLVRRQFNAVAGDFGPTKGKAQRLVPCNSKLLEELLNLINTQKIRDDETVFLNENRRPVCHANFADRSFENDVKAWGGRRIRFHDLRHTATTLLISSGVDLKTVKEICGHADVDTTMLYAHLLPGSIEKVASTFSICPE
jgi:integrase